MKLDKRYKYKLTGSIHTISIKTPELPKEVNRNIAGCMKSHYVLKSEPHTISIINVHKLNGEVYTYEDFMKSLLKILNEAGISVYNIIRADMRYDSYDSAYYNEFKKLNRYLISALAVTYKVSNTYRTEDLFSQQQLSIAIKSRYIECEHYDKNAQTKGRDAACSRLELRSKGGKIKELKNEFIDMWGKRWDKAVKNLLTVQKKYNDSLEKIYKDSKYNKTAEFRSLTDFIIRYQECIFTHEQLVELLSRFDEIKNPINRARNHKKRYGMEFFTDNDVKYAITEIKRATEEFFAVCKNES